MYTQLRFLSAVSLSFTLQLRFQTNVVRISAIVVTRAE